MGRLAFLVLLRLVLLFSTQQPDSEPAEVPLATVVAKPDQLVLRRGRDIGVTMTITAGPRGAYLPNFFGDWDSTCQAGFSVRIVDLSGGSASTAVKGCAMDYLEPGPAASQLLSEYILLKPGERRCWHATLTKIVKTPGEYRIEGEYFAANERIREVAALPEVHGLMVMGHLHAPPVMIRLR
jgi:hypothetical protein